MRILAVAVLGTALLLPALSARAQDEDQPFAEQQQDAEFKQMEVKQEMGRINPPAVVAPGPEGGPAPFLMKDRLQVLREERAEAVRLKKSPAEIAAIDAQINALQGE